MFEIAGEKILDTSRFLLRFLTLLISLIVITGCKLKAGSDPGLDLNSLEINLPKSLNIQANCESVAVIEQNYRCAPEAVLENLHETTLVWALSETENTCDWIRINEVTGEVSGSPQKSHFGNCVAAFKVSSADENSPIFTIGLDIPPPAISLSMSTCASEAAVDQPFSCSAIATVPLSESKFTYSKHASSTCGPWINVDSMTGAISGTPSFNDTGVCKLAVNADLEGMAKQMASININVPNPQIQITDNCEAAAVIAKSYSCKVGATAPNYSNPTFVFELEDTTNCSWITFDPNTKQISGTPSISHTGLCDIAIKVTLEGEITSRKLIKVNVPSPTIAINHNCLANATIKSPYSCTTSSVVQNHAKPTVAMSLDKTNGCKWLSFDSASNKISGTPTSSDIGSCKLKIKSTVDGVQSATKEFNIFVPVPTISINTNCDSKAKVGTPYTCKVGTTVSKHGNPSLVTKLHVTNTCNWLTLNGNGQISGTPRSGDGNCKLAISSVVDNKFSQLKTIFLTIPKPILSLSSNCSSSAPVGKLYSCKVTSSATNHQSPNIKLSVLNTNTCSWLNLTSIPSDGTLSGTPNAVSHLGSCSFEVKALLDGVMQKIFKVTLTTPAPPVVVNMNQCATDIGWGPYSCQLSASAAPLSSVSFEWSKDSLNNCNWLNVSATGQVTGNAQVLDSGTCKLSVKAKITGTNYNSTDSISINVKSHNYQETIIDSAGVTSSNNFGYSIAISGRFMAVGVPDGNSPKGLTGKVILYEKVGSKWTEGTSVYSTKLKSGDRFGYAVAMNNKWLLVSAIYDDSLGTNNGRVYAFKNVNGFWVEQSTPLDSSSSRTSAYFGRSIALDGSVAVIGSNVGIVDVFRDNGSSFQFEDNLKPADLATGSYFGFSVSIDNNTILAGNPNFSVGSAYVYKYEGNRWVEKQKLIGAQRFGRAVALSNGFAVIGSPGADSSDGRAYLYRQFGDTFTIVGSFLTPPIVDSNMEFGYSVDITHNRMVIGAIDGSANDSGNAFVYSRDSKSNWNLTGILTSKEAKSNDQFGWASKISPLTGEIFIGANTADGLLKNTGRISVFSP